MKLYVVSQWWNHEGHTEALGVYTSRELADAAIAEYRTKPLNRNANLDIVERVLDAPLSD